jgi:phytoene dehydrogenase-like protein
MEAEPSGLERGERGPASGAVDVVVVGAGVNGLVCALVLARAGLSVHVVEGAAAIGGGCRAERPFARAPRLAASPGAHRLGFVPKDLLRLAGVSLPLRAREPSMFVPTTREGRYLLAASSSESGSASGSASGASAGAGAGASTGTGNGAAALRDAVAAFAPGDARALDAMHAELDEIVADLAPAWLAGPLSIEETAERFVRAARREAFVALCRGSLSAYFDRFGLASEVVRAALAVDALEHAFASPDRAGSGAPLVVRHAARALSAGGADAVAVGGPGAVTDALARAAKALGVTIATGNAVARVAVEGNTVAGVVLRDGTTVRAETVVCNADPFQLRAMVGAEKLPPDYVNKIDGFTRAGSIARVRLALAELPAFTALREDRGQHRATVCLLPGGDAPLAALRAAFADAEAGRVPAAPPLACAFPTASDPSERDPEGGHVASLLVPWTPYDLRGTTWAAEEDAFLRRILTIVDSFAPGTSDRVVDAVVLHPKKLEAQLGVTRGYASQVDDAVVFGDRLPYATPIPGLYACGAGCAPAGGVFGVAGHNAAKRVLADMELGLERTEAGQR